MKVFNVGTGSFSDLESCYRVATKVQNGVVMFGYCTRDDTRIVKGLYKNGLGYADCMILKTSDIENDIIFSVKVGKYIIKHGFDSYQLLAHQYIKGLGKDLEFPYNFNRNYEAKDSFDIFKGKQKVLNPIDFPIAKYFKYSFGVEFETSQGFIPEDVCYQDGLIPLRDGSISGLEYSTVVLNGNEGFNLLYQQIQHLKKYTYFNKECALHIHLGGFPIKEKEIFVLYQVLCLLENEITTYIPAYSLKTSLYKESRKDYCKPLMKYSTFANLYAGIVETEYFGDLYQPHPNDPNRTHKWDCHTR